MHILPAGFIHKRLGMAVLFERVSIDGHWVFQCDTCLQTWPSQQDRRGHFKYDCALKPLRSEGPDRTASTAGRQERPAPYPASVQHHHTPLYTAGPGGIRMPAPSTVPTGSGTPLSATVPLRASTHNLSLAEIVTPLLPLHPSSHVTLPLPGHEPPAMPTTPLSILTASPHVHPTSLNDSPMDVTNTLPPLERSEQGEPNKGDSGENRRDDNGNDDSDVDDVEGCDDAIDGHDGSGMSQVQPCLKPSVADLGL